MPMTLTIAVVTSVLISLAIIVPSLRAEEPDVEHAKRQAALTWATEQEQQVFDEVLPRGTRHDVVRPVCRVVTLRSGNFSDDAREFRIQIVQLCDGTIRKADVSVALTPFEVQLAQMRYRDDQLTLTSAIPRLQVDHHDLGPASARRILRSLDQVRLSLNPTNALILDVVSLEVDVVSWGEIKILTYLEDNRPGWRELGATLKEAMRLSQIDTDRLRYDPQDVER
jgi:hypothetical protein